MQSFFIWKGMDSRAMGIITAGHAPIIRPEERVKHVEIPGRSGDLTLTEGEAIYQPYIQTLTISARNASRIREIYSWLRGDGYVTFSGEPDKRQAARIIGAVTLNRISRNMDAWRGEIQFYCQPLKELLRKETVTVTPGGSVTNRGDVTALPKLRVTCTGDGSGGPMDTVITIGGKSFTVVGNYATTILSIDCEAGIVTDPSEQANWTSYSSGAFPVLNVGVNTITGSGWSQIVIDRRERYL